MARPLASAPLVAPSSATLARRLPALGAILLGLVLIYGAGFAAPSVLHNAAHDGRHAFAFPCH
jgi:cobalt transporter subunit CbtB